VDDPKEANEYKIDRSLPSRMREDVTWRQTFMNILLSYYKKDVTEPEEVMIKTNEYRQENNEFENWLIENIEEKENGWLSLNDVCTLFLDRSKVNNYEKTKYKKEIEKFIKSKFPGAKCEYGNSRFNEKVLKGWKNFQLKSESAD